MTFVYDISAREQIALFWMIFVVMPYVVDQIAESLYTSWKARRCYTPSTLTPSSSPRRSRS